MRLAIMQPYLFPYLGYYQLAASVDRWVFHDDVMYIKQGYINRNSILLDGDAHRFTVPIQHQSDSRPINEHYAMPPFDKVLRIVSQAYAKSPRFSKVFPLIESVLDGRETNIAGMAGSSVLAVFDYLGMEIRAGWSSEMTGHQELKAQDRVLAICAAIGADEYVNPIGGVELYDEETFASRGIRLLFHRMRPVAYHQGDHPFVPNLSMIDVLMHNDPENVKKLLREFDQVNRATAQAQLPQKSVRSAVGHFSSRGEHRWLQ